MNIFYLDHDPTKCAQAHCNKHVVKMILETAQILSQAVRDVCKIEYGYHVPKSELKNPCIKWVKESQENFLWLCNLGDALLNEYSYRYDNSHASEHIIKDVRVWHNRFPLVPMTTRPQLMPSEFQDPDPITAYRHYYMGAKTGLLQYTRRTPPQWMQDMQLGEHKG